MKGLPTAVTSSLHPSAFVLLTVDLTTMKRLLLFALVLGLGVGARARRSRRRAAPPEAAPKVDGHGEPAPAVKAEPLQVVPDEIFEARAARPRRPELPPLELPRPGLRHQPLGDVVRPVPPRDPRAEQGARGLRGARRRVRRPDDRRPTQLDAERVQRASCASSRWTTARLGRHGDGRLALMNGVDASIPQTFVVAADGRIVLRLRGYGPTRRPADDSRRHREGARPRCPCRRDLGPDRRAGVRRLPAEILKIPRPPLKLSPAPARKTLAS